MVYKSPEHFWYSFFQQEVQSFSITHLPPDGALEAISQLREKINPENVYIGPSDFIPFLGNTKLAFIRIEGRMFANIPFSIELRLDVDDKANSAGVVIDGIRLAKLALDRKIGGPLISASAYLMKHPPQQYPDYIAKEMIEEFIKEKRER